MADERPDITAELLAALAGPLVEALSHAGVGLAVTMDDGASERLVYVNDVATRITGRAPEEVLGKPGFDFIAPEEIPRMQERRRRALAGEPVPSFEEVIVLHKDGRRIPVEAGSTRVSFHGRSTTIAFLRDVSDRWRAQEALARSEKRFRRLIELAPEGVAVLREGRFVYANQALVNAFGIDSPGALIGRPVADFVRPEERPVLDERLAALAGGQLLAPREYRGKRADGQTITVEVLSMPIEFEGAPAVLSFTRDVSERKRLQAQLLQADRMAAVGLLAAGVAHDINNPLAYVSLLLQAIARDLPRVPREPQRVAELQKLAAEAGGGVDRVAAIVRNLRSFSRVDPDQSGSVDVARVLGAAVKMAEHEIRYRADLIVEIEELPPLQGSEGRLGQVFLNLLVNGAQALPDEPDRRREIRVVARHREGTIVVEIADTGVGIPPELRERIFEPFFTTKAPGVGTGLGLSICRSVVASFGGAISVESAKGQGTTFRIALPVPEARAEATPAPERLEHGAPPGGRGRVLVIDDEPSVALAIRTMLEPEHDVHVATSGHEGLARLLADEFDCVLCDLMMTDLAGMDLYERVRRSRPGIEHRFVFLTGGAFTPRAAAFVEQVENPILPKPLSLERVRAAISSLVASPAPMDGG